MSVSRARLANAGLALGTILLVGLGAEPLLRLRYAEPLRETPPGVLQVQPYLRNDPVFGFTWKPNISAEQGVVFDIADVEFRPLSTDGRGIINPPEAIAARARGEGVDVVGLGDSFMEMAAYDFRERFARRGLQYYSLAIHRQAPPQYAELFSTYAGDLHPRLAVVGVFENDFAETDDFDRWKASGLDWFTFHSGTWCGRPVPVNAAERFVQRHFRGYRGLGHVIHSRLRGDRMTVTGPTVYERRRVRDELLRLADIAEAKNVKLLVAFIPSRASSVDGLTTEGAAYEDLIVALEAHGVATLDLRGPFAEHAPPDALYYAVDAHWNDSGIDFAGERVVQRVETLLGGQPTGAETD